MTPRYTLRGGPWRSAALNPAGIRLPPVLPHDTAILIGIVTAFWQSTRAPPLSPPSAFSPAAPLRHIALLTAPWAFPLCIGMEAQATSRVRAIRVGSLGLSSPLQTDFQHR